MHACMYASLNVRIAVCFIRIDAFELVLHWHVCMVDQPPESSGALLALIEAVNKSAGQLLISSLCRLTLTFGTICLFLEWMDVWMHVCMYVGLSPAPIVIHDDFGLGRAGVYVACANGLVQIQVPSSSTYSHITYSHATFAILPFVFVVMQTTE